MGRIVSRSSCLLPVSIDGSEQVPRVQFVVESTLVAVNHRLWGVVVSGHWY